MSARGRRSVSLGQRIASVGMAMGNGGKGPGRAGRCGHLGPVILIATAKDCGAWPMIDGQVMDGTVYFRQSRCVTGMGLRANRELKRPAGRQRVKTRS